MLNTDEIISSVIEKMPIGIIVFNQYCDIAYKNRQASIFLDRYELPYEITDLNMRIFKAINGKKLKELFPGDIYLSKRFESSESHWIFRVFICEEHEPFVIVFIIEETFSNKLDMNKIRKQFMLTRRETDVTRRVLDGLKNAEIATDLEISEQTVKDYLSNVYMKFGVENRFGLMRSLISSPSN